MKTIFIILISTTFLVPQSVGNKYMQAMSLAIGQMNGSSANSEFLASANSFERISSFEKNEWLPLYYASYCYIIISYQEQDLTKKDPYLDKAQQLLDKAFKIAPDESELFALQAFLYPSRIVVDPMARGMEYMGEMNRALDQAIKLNPENPRSYYLRAITLLNMPESFGGGAEAAKPLFEKAKEKFDSFQPENSISPNWGKELNESELNKL